MAEPDPLLAPGEPAPFALENEDGASPLVFVCEHAGARIPAALGDLGLAAEHLGRHFMVDIGALELARSLAAAFDAPLAHQIYSRMVCDCNRRPGVASFIPEAGEGVPVPANAALSEAERARRRAAVWSPFQEGVAAMLDRRDAAGRPTALVTIHSFTPVFFDKARPWEAGVLYDRDETLAPRLYEILSAAHGDLIGRNEPYAVGPDDDYTVPVHGEARGAPTVEIEVRNDQLGDEAGRALWTDRLAAALREACGEIGLDVTQRERRAHS